jgi:hypothetical protein
MVTPFQREQFVSVTQMAITGILSFGFFLYQIYALKSDLSLTSLLTLVICTLALVLALEATWTIYIVTHLVIGFYGKFGWDRLRCVPVNYSIYIGKLSKSPRSIQSDIQRIVFGICFHGAIVIVLNVDALMYVYLAFYYFIIVHCFRIAVIQPVGVLLASSNPRSTVLAALLAGLRKGHFCSYLNQREVENSARWATDINWASYRRPDLGTEWESYVSSILRYIPIVVLDIRRSSDALSTEIGILMSIHDEGDFLTKEFLRRQQLIVISGSENQDIQIVNQLRHVSIKERAEFRLCSELEFFQYINEQLDFRHLDTEAEFEAYMRTIPLE